VRIRKFVPILGWLPQYDRSWLPFDAIAGLTLWALVVPEGMAYASIAGLPPQAGLYTLVVSLLVYALFGTSRHLSVGGTSATAALLASSVGAALVASAFANAEDPQAYLVYASAFVLITGLVFLAAGVARLGFITQFLSKPVMDGFVVGLAVFVTVGQLNKLFGVPKPEGNTVEKLVGIVRELPEASLPTLAIGALALATLALLPRLSRRIPSGLVVLFGAIFLSTVLDLEGRGVEVVGTLPQGLPLPAFPVVPFEDYLAMILPAIGVLLVAFSESLGIAQEFAEQNGYEVDANQELNAHAAVNVGSALFGGMLASGGMSATAVKAGAGARSQVANVVAWAATIVTLLFLTPLFTNLPEAVLAALIIHAVWHILSSQKLLRLRREAPVEVWFGVLAMAGVVFIDVLEGMMIGLLASLAFVVYRTTRPHISSLGRVPGSPEAYSDLGRHPENEPVPGVLIIRVDAPLYYANALTARDAVRAMIRETEPAPAVVIFDGEGQDELDVTTAHVLGGLVTELRAAGITVAFANVRAPALERAGAIGVVKPADEAFVFGTVDQAVRALAPATGPVHAGDPPAPGPSPAGSSAQAEP
jgi:high affinity sulfate transporter 1